MACCFASSVLFAVVAATYKHSKVPPLLIMIVRSGLQWLLSLCAIVIRVRCSTSPRFEIATFVGTPNQRLVLSLRSLLFFLFMLFWWSAVQALPLGDATGIVYSWPLWTCLWGIVFLKEQARPSFWWSAVSTVVGLVLIARPEWVGLSGGGSPSGSGSPPSAATPTSGDRTGGSLVAAILAALAGSFVPVTVRLSRDCHWTTVEHLSSLLSCFVFGPSALALALLLDLGEQREPLLEWLALFLDGHCRDACLLVLLAACLGYCALALSTIGYQNCEAASASMVTLIEVPSSFLLQLAVFGTVPSLASTVGAGCITLACLGSLGSKPAGKRSSVATEPLHLARRLSGDD